MSGEWLQHIGDDQLIHGLPKHMAGVAGAETKGWWRYVPKATACDKCQAMKGLWFPEKPGPVHPNCQCEIRQEPIPKVNISGTLEGVEDTATEKFGAGQKITVTIKNFGPFLAGARIWVDRSEWKVTQLLLPGQSEIFTFTKFGELPVPWEVFLIYAGDDNSTLQYFIQG